MEADKPFKNFELHLFPRLEALGHAVVDFVVNRHSVPPKPNSGAVMTLDEALQAQPIPEDLWGGEFIPPVSEA